MRLLLVLFVLAWSDEAADELEAAIPDEVDDSPIADEVEIEEVEIGQVEIDEVEISDEDIPFDENDGFDIENFEDDANDPAKLDPDFRPAADDPRNIIFNNYDDWTVQANLEKMINETFKLHFIQLKDLANPMLLREKLPSYEAIYYSTRYLLCLVVHYYFLIRVKYMTGYDRWTGLEKLIICKRLADLQPLSAPIKNLYHGFWSVVHTFQKFGDCTFEIPKSIHAGIIKHLTNEDKFDDDYMNDNFMYLVSILDYLTPDKQNTHNWAEPTNFMELFVKSIIEDDHPFEYTTDMKNAAKLMKAYFTSDIIIQDSNSITMEQVEVGFPINLKKYSCHLEILYGTSHLQARRVLV